MSVWDSRLLLLVLVLQAVLRIAGAGGFALVGLEGSCKPAPQIASFLEKSKVGTSEACSVVGVVDLTGDGSGCALANSVFSTAFPDARAGKFALHLLS